MNRIPRLGFVGVGGIGRHRMEQVVKSGTAEAVALLDASPQTLAEARRSAPGATPVGSLDEMLKMDLDGIVLATPNAHHAEQAVAAMERNKHVFCQKPLGRDGPETRAIVDAARRHDRLLGVDLSYRHLNATRRVRALLDQGAIGRVFAMDLQFHNAYGPDKAWFYDRNLSGGGCLLDLGIHLVDLALWSAGWSRVRDASGRLFEKGQLLKPGDTAVEDYATVRLDLENGATATLACSWRDSAGCDAVIGATFHGETGSLRMQNVNGSFHDFRADLLRGTRSEPLVQPPDEWGGRAIVSWARRLGAGAGFDPECTRHVDVMDVIGRVYRG